MPTNISSDWAPKAASFFALIGQPVRLQLLAIMAAQEACVCHFEAVLGLRQAVISQHLMLLRRAGLVKTRRDGRNVFYQLVNPDLIPWIKSALVLSGESEEMLQPLGKRPVEGCPCPQCNPGVPEFSCQGLHPKPSSSNPR